MFVVAMEVELRILDAHSLKDKRQVVKPLVEGVRRRFQVSAAETDRHDSWQRAQLGFAVVGSSAGHVEQVLDEVERYVWSRPGIEIISTERSWLE
ncbi:MAG: DUF503 domain-containing protein [Actinomycetota bacterium]|nr:DUF503 domain-containing protein [Actinomycetota bacterium]